MAAIELPQCVLDHAHEHDEGHCVYESDDNGYDQWSVGYDEGFAAATRLSGALDRAVAKEAALPVEPDEPQTEAGRAMLRRGSNNAVGEGWIERFRLAIIDIEREAAIRAIPIPSERPHE